MAQNNTPDEPLVDWTRVLGGALAAVSSAVLLSTLGVIGTIIGAALGSIVVSVATSLYARGLNRSRHHMAHAQDAALRRVGVAQAEVRRARRRHGEDATDAHLERASENLEGARDQLTTDPEPTPPLSQRLRQLPWRRVALVAALTFAVAVAAITIFELVAGRPVSSYTGGTNQDQGTSIGDVSGGKRHASPSPSPTGGASTTPTPGEPSASEPTSSPSGSPSSTPTPTPSGSPSSDPSGGPLSGEPSPSASEPTHAG
jgi:hypothetical protein